MNYTETKVTKIIGKFDEKKSQLSNFSVNVTKRLMDKISLLKFKFLSGSSLYEIGKAYSQNCNDKVTEYFGTFRTGGKREYLVKIVCNKSTH